LTKIASRDSNECLSERLEDDDKCRRKKLFDNLYIGVELVCPVILVLEGVYMSVVRTKTLSRRDKK